MPIVEVKLVSQDIIFAEPKFDLFLRSASKYSKQVSKFILTNWQCPPGDSSRVVLFWRKKREPSLGQKKSRKDVKLLFVR